MTIFKDIYKISKLYVDFPLQDIVLEISNENVFSMYFREAQKPSNRYPGQDGVY